MISMNTIPSEKSICTTVMFNIASIEAVFGNLIPEHFFDETCREIYSLALEAFLTKSPFSDAYVIKKLANKEKEILDISVISPVGRDTLILLGDNIIEAYKNRNLLVSLDQIKSAIMEGRDYSLDDLRSTGSLDATRFRPISEIIAKMEERINNPVMDHGTGLAELDRLLNLEPGNLIVVAARPSMGKTGFIATVMWHLLDKGEGSAFFSLEMPSESIMLRMLANKSGQSLNDIRSNRIQNYQAYADAKRILSDTDSFLITDLSVDHIQIYNIGMSAVKKNPNLKNIFIDHLTYIKDPGGYNSNHLRISDVTKTLKRLAKDAGVKVWLLSQLSRGIESRPNRRPQLSDMRESGSIEEDADIVLGLYRDSYYSSREEAIRENPVNEVEIIVLKNRDGEVGGTKSTFVGPIVKFTDSSHGFQGAVEVVDYVDDEASSKPYEMPVVEMSVL